jgi:YD repeat-containing protein
VAYNGGTATATADQTKNAGSWVALGKWAFTQSGKGQQLTLAESSGGTAVADAVKIVRDTAGTTNTATHGYAYTYDADGQQTGIADTSPGAAVANYVTAYDQDGRTTSVTEDNPAGTAVHTTTYGYDADSSLTSQVHDATLATPAYGTYTYNNLDQLSQESDAKSSTDTSPQVSTFTYNPVGQVASEVKPNGNTVTPTYYASGLLYQQTEKTTGGTLVSSHAYTYDPNGDTTQNTEQLMSADNSSTSLSHTLGYTYTPMGQVATASTDGTQTESYTHDAGNNVTGPGPSAASTPSPPPGRPCSPAPTTASTTSPPPRQPRHVHVHRRGQEQRHRLAGQHHPALQRLPVQRHALGLHLRQLRHGVPELRPRHQPVRLPRHVRRRTRRRGPDHRPVHRQPLRLRRRQPHLQHRARRALKLPAPDDQLRRHQSFQLYRSACRPADPAADVRDGRYRRQCT